MVVPVRVSLGGEVARRVAGDEGAREGEDGGVERTDRDIPIVGILAGVVVSAIGVAVFLGSLAPSMRMVEVSMRVGAVTSLMA